MRACVGVCVCNSKADKGMFKFNSVVRLGMMRIVDCLRVQDELGRT